MSQNNNSSPRFAVCVDNSDYPASLELFKIYRVLPDESAEEDGDLRIMDESGEDYLYSANRFVRTATVSHKQNESCNCLSGLSRSYF